MSRICLGKGSFRSNSRYWVDRNAKSRENVMRAALEELTGHTFIKSRPTFLLNPASKRRLELDAWCLELKLGAEFMGEQHRVFPNSCHSTRAEFNKQRARDQLKVDLCRQHGVRLIIVPDSVSRDQVRNFVKLQLQDMQIPLSESAITDCAKAAPRESDMVTSGALAAAAPRGLAIAT